MTRTIKASEVKPGMEVQFDLEGWDVKGTVGTVKVLPHSVWIYTEKCCEMSLDLDSPVTVLSEPVQPEEPTEFGAKVRVRDGRFVRLVEGDAGFRVWFEEGTESWWTWDDLCEMGPVTVVPDQGWTVPAATPEVPERIEEWPEDDAHLCPFQWEDSQRDRWDWVAGLWVCYSRESGLIICRRYRPSCRPWTRVTDA